MHKEEMAKQVAKRRMTASQRLNTKGSSKCNRPDKGEPMPRMNVKGSGKK